MIEVSNGDIWIATEGGTTRYRPSPSPPTARIVSVTADRKYDGAEMIRLPTTQNYLQFAFASASLGTRPERMAFVYRLRGQSDEWRAVYTNTVEYSDLPIGDYVFEVKAVDRDLNYSEPVRVAVEVHLPYERIAWMLAFGIAAALVGWQTVRVVRRGRHLQVANQSLESQAQNLGEANRKLEEFNSALTAANVEIQQANEAKSTFLANMSHEIRTPMNAILGYAQILQHSPDLSDQHRRAVTTIHQSGDHLLALINEILDLSKIEAGRLQLNPVDFDLRELLQSLSVMIALRCKEKGLAWQLVGLDEVDEERLLVHGDPAKLSQVLLNLLGNAVKFTDEGEVVLRLSRGEADRYAFAVVDSGVGIAAAEQATLFEPFQQGTAGQSKEGTGLGLAIAQQLVALMGGQLELVSAAGEGARFFFEIELAPAHAAVPPVAATARPLQRLAAGQMVRALIADDVATNRDILQTLLIEMGAEVSSAEDGQQALDQLETFQPNILFLDMRMPVLDGQATLRKLRALGPWQAVKVVAISASVLTHERQVFMDLGFDEFIPKPFRFEEVAACLERLLGVAFAEGPAADAATAELPADWSEVVLPAELLARLHRAVELYSVTDIEECLAEMEPLADGPQRLATHLRTLRQRLDMDAMLNVLEQVQSR